MKIAILYICTGPYSKLFPAFYKSANEHFLQEKAKLDFFVWTDINDFNNWINVKVYPHEYRGFPLDSLLRFEMFLEAKIELAKYDYLYFFNANTLFVANIGEEILPDSNHNLVCRIWKEPLNFPMFYSFEKNKKSTAYIPPYNPPYLHYSGGLNGGISSAFIEMSEQLNRNIQIDLNNGIIAEAHDQSHINHYFHYHRCKIISPEYSMPEEQVRIFDHPKIIFRQKEDRKFNKCTHRNVLQRVLNWCRYLIRGLAWVLKISIVSGQEKYIK